MMMMKWFDCLGCVCGMGDCGVVVGGIDECARARGGILMTVVLNARTNVGGNDDMILFNDGMKL